MNRYRYLFLALFPLYGCAQLDKYNRCYAPPLPPKEAVAYAQGAQQAAGEIAAAAKRSRDAVKPKKVARVVYQVRMPNTGEAVPVVEEIR